MADPNTTSELLAMRCEMAEPVWFHNVRISNNAEIIA